MGGRALGDCSLGCKRAGGVGACGANHMDLCSADWQALGDASIWKGGGWQWVVVGKEDG